ncbi:hypothetical protein [Saccharomonospora piscinae]|nr:hypothetical protein [Saccharomonospora piscinae]
MDRLLVGAVLVVLTAALTVAVPLVGAALVVFEINLVARSLLRTRFQ